MRKLLHEGPASDGPVLDELLLNDGGAMLQG